LGIISQSLIGPLPGLRGYHRSSQALLFFPVALGFPNPLSGAELRRRDFPYPPVGNYIKSLTVFKFIMKSDSGSEG